LTNELKYVILKYSYNNTPNFLLTDSKMKNLDYMQFINDSDIINLEDLEQFANIQDELKYGFDITSSELGIDELIDSFGIKENS